MKSSQSEITSNSVEIVGQHSGLMKTEAGFTFATSTKTANWMYMKTPFKVGFPNPRGWLAYWWNGTLFVKRAKYEAQSAYFDFGSSSECYCNGRFIELETLVPISTIDPGASVTHVETWELHDEVDCPRHENDAQALVEKLGLE